MLATPAYDIALILDQGVRDTQEDVVAARFFDSSDAGYVVVADGMGGHEAGDVASALVVEAWREALDGELEGDALSEPALMDALPLAAMQANALIAERSQDREGGGLTMGATLLGILLLNRQLFWISIGDSPLYLFRDNQLRQINEDHSMAVSLAAQVTDGTLSAAEAEAHPDRNQLTSVIMGGAIPKVDCPDIAFDLHASDIVLMGSDGLQYLNDAQIETILRDRQNDLSQDIADALLSALKDQDDPDQDNIAIAVLKPVGSNPTTEKPNT